MTERPRKEVFTIGHSSRSLDELFECLRSFDIAILADVRSWPASRHHPQFDRAQLEAAATAEGFLYRFLGRELGGLRAEGYEAHMETDLFREGLDRLVGLTRDSAVAMLCAEREPAGCHRRHLARALEERGYTVRHIVDAGRELLPGERPGDQGTLFPL